MCIGNLLIAHGLVTAADVAAALEIQKVRGGRLGNVLIDLGKLQPNALATVLRSAPPEPNSIADTGLQIADLLNLTIKVIYGGSETPSSIADAIKLPAGIVQLILDQAKERKLVEVLGAAGVRILSELRYALTERGKSWAADALGQNQYAGPAPVPLAAYCERVQRQCITNERIDVVAIDRAFAGLVIERSFVQQIGPALNSGRAILLYGPQATARHRWLNGLEACSATLCTFLTVSKSKGKSSRSSIPPFTSHLSSSGCRIRFSTNLLPLDLMDAAFLRRIPYKLHVGAPSVTGYRSIFSTVAREAGLLVTEDIIGPSHRGNPGTRRDSPCELPAEVHCQPDLRCL